MKKRSGYIIILHKCTKTHDHTVPETWHMTDIIFTFHFGYFLPLKISVDIIILHICIKNYEQMDGQTGRLKK